ncbi:MAG: hypothetical protein IT288_07130 [Bdellovibrionales bacterium]|nr:hypothetical protein [Bdellovibrionales bacterium]
MKKLMCWIVGLGLTLAGQLASAEGDERELPYGDLSSIEKCPVTKSKIDFLQSPALRESLRSAVGDDERALQAELQEETDIVMMDVYLCSKFRLPMEEAVVDFALVQIQRDRLAELSAIDRQLARVKGLLLLSLLSGRTSSELNRAVDALKSLELKRSQAVVMYDEMSARFNQLRSGSGPTR